MCREQQAMHGAGYKCINSPDLLVLCMNGILFGIAVEKRAVNADLKPLYRESEPSSIHNLSTIVTVEIGKY